MDDIQKKYILYIEDDPQSKILVRKLLTSAGYAVLEAGDGISAIKIVQETIPNLILMDIHIPEMDGYETTTKLKSLQGLKDIPIIAVTASAMKGDRERALAAGCDGYIRKPINPYTFVQQVDEFIKGKKEKIPSADQEAVYLKEYSKKLVSHLEQKIEELTRLNTELERKVEERTLELKNANKRLEELAVTDDLTKLANRRSFENQFEIEFQRSKRFGHPLSLLIFDIDKFKKINDVYGHPYGDKALCKFTEIFKQNVREVDFVYRYGGEEFILLLPMANLKISGKIGERIRNAIANCELDAPSGSMESVKLSVSAGCVTYDSANIETKEELFEKADKALYEAKKAGGNKVICSKG